MTPDDIKVFATSLGDIYKVHDELTDLLTRINAALGSSTSLEVLMKKKKEEAKEKMSAGKTQEAQELETIATTIKGHIKEMEKLKPIAKTMRDEIAKLEKVDPQKKPEKYHNMQDLLNQHTAFFKPAEQFRETAPRFRLLLMVKNVEFYRGPLQNVHMKVINDKIESIVDHYQKMLVAYRPYKPYGGVK